MFIFNKKNHEMGYVSKYRNYDDFVTFAKMIVPLSFVSIKDVDIGQLSKYVWSVKFLINEIMLKELIED